MNVSELIELLGKLDQAAQVVVRTYDVPDDGQPVLDVKLVDAVADVGAGFTLQDNNPTATSQKVAVLEVADPE